MAEPEAFYIGIEFQKDVNLLKESYLYDDLIDEFYEIMNFVIEETGPSAVLSVNFEKTGTGSECECQKSGFCWDLIMFFADRWQEVKSVEIENGDTTIKIFPVDRGMCS